MCGRNIIILGPFVVQDYIFQKKKKAFKDTFCEKILSGGQTHNFRRKANKEL